MKIKIRYNNEFQKLEVDRDEMWVSLSLGSTEGLTDSEMEKRIQDKFDEMFNRPEYNNWHRHDRHTTGTATPRRLDGKSIHDMVAWNALPVEEQEKVIGRRKFNDVELSDEEKPQNAHNAVTNIGDDLKIVRANMPFANTSKGEYGTYFIGYASTFTTTRQMLESMFIGNPVGNTDRLLDFSTAVTGTLFFAPSYDLLSELGE